MTRNSTSEFQNPDGSINFPRAINAGHEARTQALRKVWVAAIKIIKAKLAFITRKQGAPSSPAA